MPTFDCTKVASGWAKYLTTLIVFIMALHKCNQGHALNVDIIDGNSCLMCKKFTCNSS